MLGFTEGVTVLDNLESRSFDSSGLIRWVLKVQFHRFMFRSIPGKEMLKVSCADFLFGCFPTVLKVDWIRQLIPGGEVCWEKQQKEDVKIV